VADTEEGGAGACPLEPGLKDQFRTAQSLNSMASAERESITGVWGAELPVGYQGAEPPVGVRGAKPPEAKCFFCFCVSKESYKFAPLLIFAKVSKSHSKWMSYCLTTHLQRIYMLSRRPFSLLLNSNKFNLTVLLHNSLSFIYCT